MPDLQLIEPFGIRDDHAVKFAVPEVIAHPREAVSAAQLTNRQASLSFAQKALITYRFKLTKTLQSLSQS